MLTMRDTLFGTTALMPVTGVAFAPPRRRVVQATVTNTETPKERKNRLARARRAAKKAAHD